MNKIIVDNIETFDGDILLINKCIKQVKANGKSIINIFNTNIEDLDILVSDNAFLIINYFNDSNKINNDIKINIKNNSQVILNYSFINKGTCDINIYTNFLNDNSKIFVSINGLNNKGISNINIDGYVENNKNNNILDEKIKIININNGKSISNPNMFISNNLIVANHSNTVGKIDDNALIYLMSKGISKDKCVKLICNGFLISLFKEKDFLIKIKEYLLGGDIDA